MTEIPKIPGLSEVEQDAFAANLTQLRAKRSRNLLRAGLYDGKHAVRQIGTIVPPTYYQTAVVLGWPAKAVDLPAQRINLDGFTWADGDLDMLGLGGLAHETNLIAQLDQSFRSSLLHSVAFATTTRGVESDEPEVMVHLRDALSATGVWSDRRQRLVSGLTVSEWQDDRQTPQSFTLYLPGLTVTGRKDVEWSVVRSAHRYGLPMEHLPTKPRLGRPFGTSRITRPVISAYSQAVRTAIRMEGNADVYSFPQMILLGASEDVFKNRDGSIKPAWQVALGRIFALDDDEDATNPRATVQRFEAASPEPHLKMLRQHAEFFAGETSIPSTYLGVSTDGNPTSAEALLIQDMPLIAEAEGAMRDWSPAISRTVARALAMLNDEDGVPAEFATIKPKWRDARYTSKAAAADAGAKQLGAVPWLAETEVGLELLGLDPSQIERALSEKRRAQASMLAATLAGAARGDLAG